MKGYVVGFHFSDTLDHVLLVNKARPRWQEGKLNGVGGAIEPGETHLQAMVREFKEETNLNTDLQKWLPFCALSGYEPASFVVHFFAYRSKMGYSEHSVIRYETNGERVQSYRTETLWQDVGLALVPNLRWLVPLALNALEERDVCAYFRVAEATYRGSR